MQCQNCHQPIEPGAAFCGNCGHPVQPVARDDGYTAHQYTPPAAQSSPGFTPLSPPSEQNQHLPPPLQSLSAVPAYAKTAPNSHGGETKALLSILFGVVGLVGAIVPIIGLIFAIAGVVMGTMSRHSSKRTWSTVGLIISSLAVVASLAVWAIATKQELDKEQTKTSTPSARSVLAADLSTPCFSANFIDRLRVENKQNSCDAVAYNNQTFASSTDAYKIFATKSNISNPADFTALAKTAIEEDIEANMSNFTIDQARVGSFAGSPAYIVNASNEDKKISVIEIAVYHPVKTGENVFIIVRGVNDKAADLKILEAKWEWK